MSQTTAGKLLKGFYSAAIAGIGTLSSAISGQATLGDVTTQQWLFVALFSLTAFGGTFGLAGWAGPTNGSRNGPK